MKLISKTVLFLIIAVPVIHHNYVYADELNFKSRFLPTTLDLELSAFSVKEEALLSRGAATNIEGHFGYLLYENVKITLWPVASFLSGQQTSRDPQIPLTNSIYLKEASAGINLGYNLNLKLGALYQKDYLPGMAGETKSLPSIALKYEQSLYSTDHLISLNTQGAVPTSSGLANSTTELEAASSLLSATLMLNSKWSSRFSTNLSYSQFKFEHLSSQAANDSLQRGNSVVKINSSAGSFVYKYAGNEIIFALNYSPIANMDLRIRSSYIKNNLAPSKLNQGYFYSLSPGFILNSKFTVRTVFEKYHVQSDAMVSIFSDTGYGRTNRDGSRAGLSVETSKYAIQIFIAQSKLIQSNPFQSADKSIFLNLDLGHITL